MSRGDQALAGVSSPFSVFSRSLHDLLIAVLSKSSCILLNDYDRGDDPSVLQPGPAEPVASYLSYPSALELGAPRGPFVCSIVVICAHVGTTRGS